MIYHDSNKIINGANKSGLLEVSPGLRMQITVYTLIRWIPQISNEEKGEK
jgi:hypothetical protein